VPKLVAAIQRFRAPRLCICNSITQSGEIDNLGVSGDLRAIEVQLASLGVSQPLFTAILSKKKLFDSS